MSRKANPTAIGAFVVGALTLAVLGVILFGSGRIFKDREPLVMYFEESVQGLDIGAPIIFRGVAIGSVTDIDLVLDVATKTPRIVVRGEFLRETVSIQGKDARRFWESEDRTNELNRILIEDGMRAQLGVSSIITGKLIVNMVFRPESDVNLVEADENYVTPDGSFEIPTVKSELAAVKDVIERVMNKLAELPLDETLRDLSNVLDGADKLINKPELAESIDEARALLVDMRRLVDGVEAKSGPLLDEAQVAVSRVSEAAKSAQSLISRADDVETAVIASLRRVDNVLTRADSLLRTANRVISPGEPLHDELIVTIRDLSSAARSVRSLADTLERDPNSILFGRGR